MMEPQFEIGHPVDQQIIDEQFPSVTDFNRLDCETGAAPCQARDCEKHDSAERMLVAERVLHFRIPAGRTIVESPHFSVLPSQRSNQANVIRRVTPGNPCPPGNENQLKQSPAPNSPNCRSIFCCEIWCWES